MRMLSSEVHGALRVGGSSLTTAQAQRALVGQVHQHQQRFKSTGSKKNLPHDQPYLQKSTIPTYHFQKSLPRLPIPALEQTLKKYLASTQPLLTPAEFENTKKAVEEFSKKDGPELHAQLLAQDKANKHTSFISEMWFDMYLKGRDPVPINSNPFLMMRDDPNPKANNQITRATNLVVSSLRFLKSLQEEKLFPEVFFMKGEFTPAYENFIRLLPRSVSYYAAYAKEAYPLDMSQYYRLFGTTRVPHEERDLLASSNTARHIIVMVGGRLYALDVLNELREAKSAKDIAAGLKGILEASKKLGARATDEESLGLFTSENRTVWANYRQKLAFEKSNADLLHQVESALFVLCLDPESPTTQEASNRLFLHGDARNRWFDKSFSILVAANGKAAVNFEHSWGDGVAVLRYVNEIYDDSTRAPALDVDAIPANPSSGELLKFTITDEVKQGLRDAAKKIDSTISSLEFSTQILDGVGKRTFKKANVSPDGATQMAFQLAYRRMYGGTAATYESASTAGFLHGRTETIRPASMESVAFVDAFLSSSASRETKEKLFREAVNKHSALVKDALTGKGMDRHLFALLNLGRKRGGALPALFQDKAYTVINHNILSTSTLTSPAIEGGGFGPVVADGYGLGYGVENDLMGFNVTSYGRQTDTFVDHIKRAVIEIRDVLEGGNK